MMNNTFKWLFFFVILSCGQQQSDTFAQSAPLYLPQYAQGFLVKEEGNLRILYVKKSWSAEEQHDYRYVLYPRSDSLLYQGKAGYIPYPLNNVVCLSTTHVAYLESIEQSHLITGISGAQYLSNQRVRAQATDVGYEGALNYEALLLLHPDVVFAYGIAGASTAYLEPLAKMGVQVVYMGDYLEAHPLGKAEYMVAFSAFFGVEVMEKCLRSFEDICHTYNDLKELTQNLAPRAKVVLNAPYKDVWYIPGGDNYMTRLLADAGGLVLGSTEGVVESRSIGLEQAYKYALEADLWLHPNAFRSLNALGESDFRFRQIPAFKAKRVYNNTLRSTAGGGSDFWERGVTEPHTILADLIKIIHPELIPEHGWVYYEQLK